MLTVVMAENSPDDARIIRDHLNRFLADQHEEGHLVHYPDGEAVALGLAGDADLVLLDIDMPRLNGLDAARRLRERGVDAPLCFMTNYGSLAPEGYAVEAMGFLVKPVSYRAFASYVYDYSNPVLYQDMVIVLLLLSLCTVVIIVANAHNLAAQVSANEVLSMQQLLRDQHLHIITQRSAAEAVNRRHHDLKHVISQLESLAESGSDESLDELRAFAGTLQREIDPYVPDVRTGNDVLDVLLTEKYRQCLESNLRPHFFVDGSRLSFVNDFDLCTLIGNAADNAMEATARLCADEPRDFSLSVTYRADIAVIRCANRFSGTIDAGTALPRTTKEDDGIHGIGMRSMERTAEKYGGHLSWSVEGDRFILVIMLPIPPKPDQGDAMA